MSLLFILAKYIYYIFLRSFGNMLIEMVEVIMISERFVYSGIITYFKNYP
jgi:hypothetical protein